MNILDRLIGTLVRVATFLLNPPYRLWQWLRQWLTALKPCRFSILMVLAGILFLAFVPQGRDVLRVLAEHDQRGLDGWTRIFFFVAALLWSVSGWYWAQEMLKLSVPNVPGQVAELQSFRIWTPRVIGSVAVLGLALAFVLAAGGYDSGAYEEVRAALHLYAWWCLAGGVLFLLATATRRPLAQMVHSRIQSMPVMQHRVTSPVVAMLNLKPASENVYGMAESFAALPLLTRRLLASMIVLAVVLFFIFVFAVQTVAPVLGAAAILLLAASGWIAVGSVLDVFGMRRRIPVFTLILALAVVFSLWNDNHRVHELKDGSPEIWENRPDVRAALRQWLARQQDRPTHLRNAKIPMYVVNAEGGGIRAAYWTATVLGTIQQENPCFADHLFSMSGVSGGSLGVSVFQALLADAQGTDNGFRCDRRGKPVADTTQMLSRAQRILSHDFLSPVMAGMLYPDLFQRILPVGIPSFDRGRMLEAAFEHAWEKESGNKRFAEPVDKLWQDRRDVWMPALLLNATWVETGKRLIASNLRLLPRGEQDEEDFVDIEDTHRFFGKRALALSTAVHLSARFSYVSPAGTLVDAQGQTQGRAVDGGYFENSGATTTLEILKAMDQLAASDPAWDRVDVTVIHISNEPVKTKYPDARLASAANNPATRPTPLLNEVLSPPLALVNTRGARGMFARDTLAWHVGHSRFLHFGLCEEKSGLPLGWVLSKNTQGEMGKQLAQETCVARNDPSREIFNNPNNLCEIRQQLAARFASPGTKIEECR